MKCAKLQKNAFGKYVYYIEVHLSTDVFSEGR